MIVVDPRQMQTREWCDVTAARLDRFVAVMKIDSDDQWRNFGTHARMLLRRKGVETPDPAQFEDWREWAIRFNQSIASLT